MKKLKTALKGAEKLMPLHQRIATGNKPIIKPERSVILKKK